MDLKEIADQDRAALLEFFRTVATQGSNRFFLDLFGIIAASETSH